MWQMYAPRASGSAASCVVSAIPANNQIPSNQFLPTFRLLTSVMLSRSGMSVPPPLHTQGVILDTTRRSSKTHALLPSIPSFSNSLSSMASLRRGGGTPSCLSLRKIRANQPSNGSVSSIYLRPTTICFSN